MEIETQSLSIKTMLHKLIIGIFLCPGSEKTNLQQSNIVHKLQIHLKHVETRVYRTRLCDLIDV